MYRAGTRALACGSLDDLFGGIKPMGVAIGVAAAVASGTGMTQFPSLGELWAVLLAFSAFYVVCATEAAQ